MLILLQMKQRRMSWKTLLYSMTWQQALKLPRSSVEYSNEILFAEEANESERGGASRWQPFFWYLCHSTLINSSMWHHHHNRHILAHFQYGDQESLHSMIPFWMVTMILPPMRFRSEQGQLEPATLFNAELVVDSELASSASLVDVEAEETAQCQRQVKTALLIFLVIDIFVSIPIQLKKNITQNIGSIRNSISKPISKFVWILGWTFVW